MNVLLAMPMKYIPVKKRKITRRPRKPARYLVCDQELRAEEARQQKQDFKVKSMQ